MNYWLVIYFLAALFGGSCFDAFAQTQSANTCVMNCNTQAGTCQGSCSTPVLNILRGNATSSPGDISVGTQCVLNCSTAQQQCQQSCRVQFPR